MQSQRWIATGLIVKFLKLIKWILVSGRDVRKVPHSLLVLERKRKNFTNPLQNLKYVMFLLYGKGYIIVTFFKPSFFIRGRVITSEGIHGLSNRSHGLGILYDITTKLFLMCYLLVLSSTKASETKLKDHITTLEEKASSLGKSLAVILC